MSSSRSISAARQRRAGDPQPVSQRPPGTSINSQKAFSQQQQQPNKNHLPSQAPQVPVGKLSVGDAFALVTIRLGRIETIIQKLEADGVIGPNANPGGVLEHDENMRLVDDTVIRNMIARLNDLEKGQTTFSAKLEANVTDRKISNDAEELQKQIDQLKNDFDESKATGVDSEIEQTIYQKITHLQNQIFHLKNDFMELKEILMKLQSFSMETNQKVVSIANAQETMTQNLLLAVKDECVQGQTSKSNDSVSSEPEPEPEPEFKPAAECQSEVIEGAASTEVEEEPESGSESVPANN